MHFGFIDGKFDCMLLGVWLGSADGINIGPNKCIGLGKALGDLNRLLLGKCDGIELVSS